MVLLQHYATLSKELLIVLLQHSASAREKLVVALSQQCTAAVRNRSLRSACSFAPA